MFLFVSCLYHCSKHFAEVAFPFLSRFAYALKNETDATLIQCLEILARSAPNLAISENGIEQEIKMVRKMLMDHWFMLHVWVL